MNSQKLFY